jgi:hypothetical protein
MTMERDVDLYGNELLRAGERAPAGRYKLVDSSMTVELQEDDVLPGCLNGRVSWYVRLHFWGDAGNRLAATQHSSRSAGDDDALAS